MAKIKTGRNESSQRGGRRAESPAGHTESEDLHQWFSRWGPGPSGGS